MGERIASLKTKSEPMPERDIWVRYRQASPRGPERRWIQQELIEKYQYLVKFVIRRMNISPPRELDYEDLVSYGNIGLLDAIERFDPSLGFAFQTYAASRIGGTILDELRRFDWISRTGREKIHALEKASEQVLRETGKVSNQKVMEKTGMTAEQLREVQEIANRSYIGFLDEKIVMDDTEVEKRDIIVDEGPSIEEIVDRNAEINKLHEAIGNLTEREQNLIYFYYFKYWNFGDIAREFHLSESRISQLHKRILQKLKTRLTKQIDVVA